MDWCRLWHDMPTDPKWKVVARKSGRTIPEVIAVYTHMLVTASKAEERGTLAAWDDEDVAASLDMDTEHVTAIREAMQGKVLDGESLSGWEKRQPGSDDSAKRKRKERERKRDTSRTDAECHVTSRDRDGTFCDLSPEQRRAEKNREESNGEAGASGDDDWTDDAALYRRGKAILGQSRGSTITNLKTTCGDVFEARRVIEASANKEKPLEYVNGAIQRKRKEANKQQRRNPRNIPGYVPLGVGG